ncbi:MAG: nucleotidyltransferase family protein [Armatimonadota bacterium]|nr:nucleotidyltransferase family protein [Armatimonadota bacterium]MDR7575765.1 nucleotidyltransferase family protein [Armatimonadota bacterium]MDR7585228.1 nucleotidyltransferase family protein [Armatimonadota bacterium]
MSTAPWPRPALMPPRLYPFERTFLRLLHLEPLPPDLPTDWDAVHRLARREQVIPLLWDGIRRAGVTVPGPVARELASASERAAQRAVRVEMELAAVLSALNREGVRPLLLKGAALARATYPDPALRPMHDLDLLVAPETVNAAHRALCALGYRIAGGAPSAADRTWRSARGYMPPSGLTLPVDLHWRYAGYPHLLPLDHDAVACRARPVDVAGAQALLPAPADLIVGLAVFWMRELWYGRPRARYIRDIAEVAARGGVDWTFAGAVCVEARRTVQVAVALAADLFGAPVPAEALAVLEGGRWPYLARRLTARLQARLLREEAALSAIVQVGLLRWLGGEAPADFLRWVGRLVWIPQPLAAGRRRWLRRLWGAVTSGTPRPP